MKMRAVAVHVCPLWEDEKGRRHPGVDVDPSHPSVVGWVNVLEVEIAGRQYRLLLTREDQAPL